MSWLETLIITIIGSALGSSATSYVASEIATYKAERRQKSQPKDDSGGN